MAFDVGSVVTHFKADTTGFQKGVEEAKGQVDSFQGSLRKLSSGIMDFAKQASIVSGVVGAGLTIFLKQSSEEANNFARSMTTLEIISGRFGVSADEAKKSAQSLGQELRIGTGSAAESLQNLLKSGLGLNEASDLLKRFTNEAMTGKSPTISLSQAVQNLSFAYATNNSALGNLSGISENFMDITERGREALLKEGKAAAEITDEMAKFRGMIDLTNLTMGSAERFTGTLIDKQAQLSQKIIELKIAIGDQLNPILSQFIDYILTSGFIEGLEQVATKFFEWIKALQPVGEWILNNQEMVMRFLKGIAVGIAAIIVLAPILVAVLNPYIALFGAISVAIGLLYVAWDTNWLGIKKATLEGTTYTQWLMQGMLDFIRGWGGKLFDHLTKPFRDAWGTISDIVNKIKESLDFTKRHSPSVLDIVESGVGKVNKALSGLMISPQISPVAAITSAGGASMTKIINGITVDMSGAIVSNEQAALEMGERIGDSIVRRLSQNVRF